MYLVEELLKWRVSILYLLIRMLLSWHLLSPSLLLLWIYTTRALCPELCICKHNDKGQRKVSCTKGGMVDPIPVTQMDPALEILEISAPPSNPNRFTMGPIFQRFKSLQEVAVRRSNVLQVTMHAFWGVPSIRLLDLSVNNISAVFDHNFRGLVNLVELNLDENRIERVQVGAFKHLTELRMLSMQRNMLSNLVPRIFVKLSKLHVLKLNYNMLEDLEPDVFKDVPDLRVLELRGCGLKRINPQMYHFLPYLSHLDLGNNQFPFLDAEEFQDLHRLHSLKLDGNLLSVILDKTFVNQHQLKYLCLARNRLAKITDTAFVNLTSLVELDISFNKLKKLESFALNYIANTLQRLVISGNYFTIEGIKSMLQTLHRVWHLEMAQMKLSRFPNRFFPDGIKKLNISQNEVRNVSVSFFPKQLLELDLSHNQLKGLNDTVILKLKTLKFLDISGNPWSCTLCHITPIIYHVNKTDIFKNLSCASPSSLVNRKLSTLRLKEIPSCRSLEENEGMPNHQLGLLIGLICIIVFGIFSVIFVVFSCVRRHQQNLARQQKRSADRAGGSLESATAIFSKGEISFKFPLDLTERKMSVSTIDEIKRDADQSLPNGTVATGI